jgi:hypothetical protein
VARVLIERADGDRRPGGDIQGHGAADPTGNVAPRRRAV